MKLTEAATGQDGKLMKALVKALQNAYHLAYWKPDRNIKGAFGAFEKRQAQGEDRNFSTVEVVINGKNISMAFPPWNNTTKRNNPDGWKKRKAMTVKTTVNDFDELIQFVKSNLKKMLK